MPTAPLARKQQLFPVFKLNSRARLGLATIGGEITGPRSAWL